MNNSEKSVSGSKKTTAIIVIIAFLILAVVAYGINSSREARLEKSIDSTTISVFTSSDDINPVRFHKEKDGPPVGIVTIGLDESAEDLSLANSNRFVKLDEIAHLLTVEQLSAISCVYDLFEKEPIFKVEARANNSEISFVKLGNWYKVDPDLCKLSPLKKDDIANVTVLWQGEIPPGFK